MFLAPISVGGQTFNVVMDTGSSDTWVVLNNFTCFDPVTNEQVTQQECYFASYYRPSSTVHYLPDRNFNISYADGETLSGIMAYENLTIAGIALSQQEIALIENAAWYGDGYSSGLMGLAYATLTSAYYGDNPRADTPGNTDEYNPPLTTMFASNLTSPVFSLALRRPSSHSGFSPGGSLAIGGIPNVTYDRTFSSTPISVVGVNTENNDPIYEYYTIGLGGWAISKNLYTQFDVYGTGNPLKSPLLGMNTYAIVDSGTSLVYAPSDVAAAAAAAYSPAATFSDEHGMYVVDCDATPPLFGVVIADKVFYVNPSDLVLQESNTLCITGMQAHGQGNSILGDVFLRNVLAVFDVGAAELRFAARQFT